MKADATPQPSQRRDPAGPPRADNDVMKVERCASTESTPSEPCSSTPRTIAETSAPSDSSLPSPPASRTSSVFTTHSTRGGSTSASSLSSEVSLSAAAAVTAEDVWRELRDVEREMCALAARRSELTKELARLCGADLKGTPLDEWVSGPACVDSGSCGASIRQPFLGDEASFNELTGKLLLATLSPPSFPAFPPSRLETNSAPTALRTQLQDVTHALYDEHRRRVAAENALADEGLVPALVDALVEVAALTEAVVAVKEA